MKSLFVISQDNGKLRSAVAPLACLGEPMQNNWGTLKEVRSRGASVANIPSWTRGGMWWCAQHNYQELVVTPRAAPQKHYYQNTIIQRFQLQGSEFHSQPFYNSQDEQWLERGILWHTMACCRTDTTFSAAFLCNFCVWTGAAVETNKHYCKKQE